MKIRHSILGIGAGIGAFFLSGSIYANVAQNNSKSVIVPYQLPNSSYIFINQSGEISHPSTQTFSDVTYYPESKIWQATQKTYQPWQKDAIYINTFFNELGQIVEINKDDLILKKLDEKFFLKYSSNKNRYLLTDREGNVIKQLDPKIIDVEPFSSGLAVAKINMGSGKNPFRYGYIDHKGEWVVKPLYKSADAFNGNLASVELGANKFLIDKKGIQVFKQTPELRRYSLSNGYWENSIAKNKGQWFTHEILNPQNKVIAKNLGYIKMLSKNLFLLRSNLKGEGEIGILNTATGEILPTKGVIDSVGGYYDIRKDNDYSWLEGYHLNKRFYRLVDRDGNTIIEDDYRNVDRYFWGYGWLSQQRKKRIFLSIFMVKLSLILMKR